MKRIRSRLVVAFLIVALLPAIPLSVLVRSLLERSFEPPFGEAVDEALAAGLEESRERLQQYRTAFAMELEHVRLPSLRAGEIPANAGEFRAAGAGSPSAEGPNAEGPNAGESIVIRLLTRTADGGMAPAEVPPGLRRLADRRLREGPAVGLGAPERNGRWLAATYPVDDERILLFARPLPVGMEERAERLVETIGLLRAYGEERPALLRGYVLPFVLSYGLLLIVAAVVASLLARRLARPVEALSEAARRVGADDFDARVDVQAPGELGDLVAAFNRMVADLAERRREIARLERLAAWRDLARGLAHEIKNPLTPIQLAVQQLADRYPARSEDGAADDSARDDYAELLAECREIVDEEVASLRTLVREFSEFARLPEPRPEWGDLGATFADLGRLYGERVSWRAPEGGLYLRYDDAELRRALINLIDNGLAACATAGAPEQVELEAALVPAPDGTADEAGEHVRLLVRDRGAGIPPENLERVFEPNFSTKKEGMGLGLAIVEGIVRGHGGSIEVASRAGEGTVFTICLPAGEEAADGASPASPVPPAAAEEDR